MRLTTVRSLFVLAALAIVGAAAAQSPAEEPGTTPPPPERQAAPVEHNLKTFDVLDFDVFSNQKWDRLHESHGKAIVVTWPDGHETKGIDRHISGASSSARCWPSALFRSSRACLRPRSLTTARRTP